MGNINKNGGGVSVFKALSGFTLAEVLITLGIIGIVAALTMPSLIAKHQEKVAVTKLKKVYSTLSNAFAMALAESGEDAGQWLDPAASSNVNAETVFNHMKPYLKISKECGSAAGCFTTGYNKTLHGTNYENIDIDTTSGYKFILQDGTAVQINIQDIKCAYRCGNMKVDIDGFKGPYTLGRDFFYFSYRKNKIVARGEPDDTVSPFETYCNLKSTRSANGDGCTAWVIMHENMDYLHCDDLSWGGKTRCN